MRVAVTGATGNIGSLVVDQLLAAGHEVTGISRRAPAGGEVGGHVHWVELDLTARDRRQRLRDAFAGVDAVVHTAWGFQPTRNTAYLQRLDVGGTAAVLAAAVHCRVGHLVHVSSIGVYSPGRDVGPVEEDWPTGGTPWLAYSRHKSAAERLLDAHESVPGPRLPRVARVRPSLVARESVGGSLDRYILPSLLPAAVLRALPVLPLDRGFRMQLTHTTDVAAGICAVVEHRATGAFNLAADPVLTRADVVEAFGVPAVHLPWGMLRALASAAWTARLQPVDPGWLDMAWDVPVLSSHRAGDELGWRPRHDSREVLQQVVRGLVRQSGTGTPALRPRRWPEQLANLVRHGPVSRRQRA